MCKSTIGTLNTLLVVIATMFHVHPPSWPPTSLLRRSPQRDCASQSSSATSSKKSSIRRCFRKQASHRSVSDDESKSSQNTSKPSPKSASTPTPPTVDRQSTIISKLPKALQPSSKTDAGSGGSGGGGKRDKKRSNKKSKHHSSSSHKRSLSQPVSRDEDVTPVAMFEEESKEAPQGFQWTFPITRSEDGHSCVSLKEKEVAESQESSLLFGELLPVGASKLFDSQHLNLANAKVVYDLGMGCGKVALQSFIEYENLDYVLGVELCASRFELAADNLLSYAKSDPANVTTPPTTPTHKKKSSFFSTTSVLEHTSNLYPTPRLRTLEFACGDLFKVEHLHKADVVLLITQFPAACYVKLLMFLTNIRPNAKLATYLDIGTIYSQMEIPCPFAQLEMNYSKSDRFFSSWATKTGAHFFLYRRLTYKEERKRKVGDPLSVAENLDRAARKREQASAAATEGSTQPCKEMEIDSKEDNRVSQQEKS